MAWRVTYTKNDGDRKKLTSKDTGALRPGVLVSARSPIELRDNTGQIVRLGPGSTFMLQESPLGLMPVYGDGPVFIARKGGCGKYRTSCWMDRANPVSDRPDIFIKPGKTPGTDEFYAVSGDIVIYEFDESGRTFVICCVSEGHKAIISYNSSKSSITQRYESSIEDISDSEWDMIVTSFLDPRKWR